jgi:hypothetical protein
LCLLQLVKTRFSANAFCNPEVVGACLGYLLKELLRDKELADRLPTLTARSMELVSLLLWSSVTEQVLVAQLWAQCSKDRLLNKPKLQQMYRNTSEDGVSMHLDDVRMEKATMLKLCKAVTTIYWV